MYEKGEENCKMTFLEKTEKWFNRNKKTIGLVILGLLGGGAAGYGYGKANPSPSQAGRTLRDRRDELKLVKNGYIEQWTKKNYKRF